MIIPTGSRHTATLKVKAWIPVNCEHCTFTFAYLTQKEASGEAKSVLWLDESGAKERARKLAVSNIEKTLSRTVDPVPCPQCGRLQAPMLVVLRRARWRLGWLLGGGAAIVWLFWTLLQWNDTMGGGYWAVSTAFPQVLAAVAAVGSVVAGYAWANALDPLDTAAKKQKGAPDTSPLSKEQYLAIKEVGWVLAEE